MRGALTAALAIVLLFLAYLESAKPEPPKEKLVLTSDVPIKEVHECLRIYGSKAAEDLKVGSVGSDLGGQGYRGGFSPSGGTYTSKASKLELTLKTVAGRSQLVIQSASPLHPAQVAVFRWCAHNGARIPFDWDRLPGL
jgi:hypothetical protein